MFKVGDVIRYDSGPTALMQVSHVSEGHGGSVARYYGQQFYGGNVGAYHEDCRAPTAQDLQLWIKAHAVPQSSAPDAAQHK